MASARQKRDARPPSLDVQPAHLDWPEDHPFRHVHPECCGGCGTKSLADKGKGRCWRCGWTRPPEELILFDLPAWRKAKDAKDKADAVPSAKP